MSRPGTKRMQLLAAVERIAVPKGWDPDSIMIPAELESGRFRRIIGWNNVFGIKAPRLRPWLGRKVKRLTTEIFTTTDGLFKFLNKHLDDVEKVGTTASGDFYVKVYADFCDWDREEDAVKYYMNLIKRLYKVAHAHRGNPRLYYHHLISGKRKYATDPRYDKKLIALYNQKVSA